MSNEYSFVFIDSCYFDKKIARREFLKLMAAGSLFLGLGAFGISNVLKSVSATNTSNMSKINNLEIRPFNVNVPEEELTELRKRINATRWPERELVTDVSQGVQLATMQKLSLIHI